MVEKSHHNNAHLFTTGYYCLKRCTVFFFFFLGGSLREEPRAVVVESFYVGGSPSNFSFFFNEIVGFKTSLLLTVVSPEINLVSLDTPTSSIDRPYVPCTGKKYTSMFFFFFQRYIPSLCRAAVIPFVGESRCFLWRLRGLSIVESLCKQLTSSSEQKRVLRR